MKKTTKLKRWGFIQLSIGIVLIISGVINGDFMPNMALLIPGVFITFLAIPILITGYSPEITKFTSNVQSEVMEHAKDDISDVYEQKTDIVEPTLKRVSKTVGTSFNEGFKTTKTQQLAEVKELLDNNLINEEEYEQMRKNILGL